MNKLMVQTSVVGVFLPIALLIVISCNKQPAATSAGVFTTALIDRGDIITTITSSGTLQPVSTVEIGTQVSGIVEKLYVDFNDTVSKGQVIAELDRTFLSGALDEAVASQDRALALYDFAKIELDRNESLYTKGFISEQIISKLRTDLRTQKAVLHSADAAVKKARTNLHFATIRSPISGTVINRSIEAGQTVAASFSSPTLFIIAEDLHTMQILANVDEADIGSIQKEQKVRFSVQAYPERIFYGTVGQVRLQPVLTQNVVTYTVVIAAENKDGLLLPGMTATVDFIIAEATAVLRTPNAALRFKPSNGQSEHAATVGTGRVAEKRSSGNSTENHMQISPRKFNNRVKIETSRVWVQHPDNQISPVAVVTGISDGKYTEIKSADSLDEKSIVVVGMQQTEKKRKKSVSLIPQSGPPGRR